MLPKVSELDNLYRLFLVSVAIGSESDAERIKKEMLRLIPAAEAEARCGLRYDGINFKSVNDSVNDNDTIAFVPVESEGLQ